MAFTRACKAAWRAASFDAAKTLPQRINPSDRPATIRSVLRERFMDTPVSLFGTARATHDDSRPQGKQLGRMPPLIFRIPGLIKSGGQRGVIRVPFTCGGTGRCE